MTALPHITEDVGPATVPTLDELRGLSSDECADIAASIRGFLIDQVTRTGGHLGANLSSVELTIALHRAFRSPETRIIWDTGHQSYTHKILTGRYREFSTLRRRHGLSGFPSQAESPHDLLENSHASVGPAWALGVAVATRKPTVVVIGDGALTGGVAFEALNAIGYRKAPVIVVINDNGRSYAPTPSHLTYGEPMLGDDARPAMPSAFFESLGLAYRGPVDGHDIAALDTVLTAAANGPLPCVVHVRTQKGNGWPSALDDDHKRLHDIGPNHPPAAASPGWSAAIGDLICELAEADPRVHAITAAMSETVGLEGFQLRFPDRYHDLGIAEQACVAMAAGLASQGRRPFFAVITTFLTRALDQVLNDVALHRLPVVFLLDRAGVTGPDGASHHGAYDVGLLRAIPGVEIYSPSTIEDVRDLLQASLRRDHGPLVIRYPKGRPVPVDNDLFSCSGLVREGRDVCLVAHGPTASIASLAARILHSRDGVDCAVWRLARIHPLEPELVRFAEKVPLVVPVEDVSDSGGIAAPLAYELARRGARVPCVEPLTLPGGFLPHGSRDELLGEFGLTPAGVADFVRSVQLLGRPASPGSR